MKIICTVYRFKRKTPFHFNRVSQMGSTGGGTVWAKWPKTAWILQNRHSWVKAVGGKPIFFVGYSPTATPSPPHPPTPVLGETLFDDLVLVWTAYLKYLYSFRKSYRFTVISHRRIFLENLFVNFLLFCGSCKILQNSLTKLEKWGSCVNLGPPGLPFLTMGKRWSWF